MKWKRKSCRSGNPDYYEPAEPLGRGDISLSAFCGEYWVVSVGVSGTFIAGLSADAQAVAIAKILPALRELVAELEAMEVPSDP